MGSIFWISESASLELQSETSRLIIAVELIYTAKNATDLMQVVDFTGLMQFANKLYQVCWLHQVASSLY